MVKNSFFKDIFNYQGGVNLEQFLTMKLIKNKE